MTVYTRRGDKGMTDLADGRRVSKSHPQVRLLGELDRLNARVGLLSAELRALSLAELQNDFTILRAVQSRLFAVGALAAAASDVKGLPTETDILSFERAIDKAGMRFEGFILPGGSRAACEAHLARTECRLLESAFWAWLSEETNDGSAEARETVARYLNRLSDYLFVLASKINALLQIEEEFWP